MINTMRINSNYDIEIQKVFKDYLKLNIPLEDIDKIMSKLEENDPDFWIKEYNELQGFSDTLVRDYLFDGLVEVFIPKFKHWPRICDNFGDEFEVYLKNLAEARNWI